MKCKGYTFAFCVKNTLKFNLLVIMIYCRWVTSVGSLAKHAAKTNTFLSSFYGLDCYSAKLFSFSLHINFQKNNQLL